MLFATHVVLYIGMQTETCLPTKVATYSMWGKDTLIDEKHRLITPVYRLAVFLRPLGNSLK